MALVSVIIPCFNEEKTIELLLEAVYEQTFSHRDVEVIIADGLSTDRTRQEIAGFHTAHPDMPIQLVDNPRRNIPAALNSALLAATGEYVVRLDAHSEPAPDYIENCLADLRDGKGEVVGGVWTIRPGGSGWSARSIAAAASHPVGVGDALYRYTTQAGWVDTVPFGSFRRELVQQIGPFDETLLTNEDYEFNTRVRQNGGRVWLNPAIRCVYFARSSLSALIGQYWRYGFWKFQMLRRYPGSLRWRQALPPVFVLSLLFWALVGFFWPAAWILLALELAVYAGILVFSSISIARRLQDWLLLLGIPAAIASMHLAWGAGFLGSMVKSGSGWDPRRK